MPATPAVLPTDWRWLDSGVADGVTNMAVDAALLDMAAGASHGVLRWYGWARPTVSFGRHEAVRDVWDADRLARDGVDAVRRPTGGRALLHARELTYSVTMPLAPSVPWRSVYDAINAQLERALRGVGVPVTRAASGADHADVRPADVRPADTRPADSSAPARETTAAASAASRPARGSLCFGRPDVGELLLHGRKLAGSAVWRTRDAYLQHGSILLADDQAWLARLSPDGAAPPRVATLAEWWPSRSADEITEDVRNALCSTWWAGEAQPAPWKSPAGFSSRCDAHARAIAAPAWLWRR